MPTYRILERVITAAAVEAAPGFYVRRPLPVKILRQLSPYLLLDHMGPEQVPAGHVSKLPPHPLRGFMPVTLLFEGAIDHRDSTGTHTTLNRGEVGWMTAGKGIVNAEIMKNPSSTEKGVFHGVRLWVNLPARYKHTAPAYQRISSDSIPVWQQQGAQLRIIAGNYQEHTGPAPIYSPMLLAHGTLAKGAKAFLPIPAHFQLAVYVLQGVLTDAGRQELNEAELGIWNSEGEGVQLEAVEESQFLLLAGQPIDEPLATYGSFVMNRPEELLQAVDDYKAGRMGSLS